MSTRTAVVLPDPLGPSRPNTVPSSTAKLTPSRARTSRLPLKVFCRLSTSMALVMVESRLVAARMAMALAGGRWDRGSSCRTDHVQSRYIAPRRGQPWRDGGRTGRAYGGHPAADAPGRRRPAPLASSHGQRRQGTRLRAPRRGRRAAPPQRAGGVGPGGPLLLPGGHDLRVHQGELPLPGHEGRVRGGGRPAGRDQRRRRSTSRSSSPTSTSSTTRCCRTPTGRWPPSSACRRGFTKLSPTKRATFVIGSGPAGPRRRSRARSG